jgi:hypothetical protein
MLCSNLRQVSQSKTVAAAKESFEYQILFVTVLMLGVLGNYNDIVANPFNIEA